VVVESPNVGKNMQDQIMLSIQYSVNTSSLQEFFSDTILLDEALDQWEQTQTGFAASNVLINTIGFFRLESDIPPFSTYPDPSSSKNSPNICFAFEDLFVGNPNQEAPTSGDWITGSLVVQSPTSRGSVNLTSTSAFTHPAIDPAFLTTNFDIEAVIQAIRTMQKFFNTSAFADYIIAPHPDAARLTSDQEILEYAKQWSNTLHHPVSTARISNATSTDGVVGPNLCVKGTTGLRVVDASILPFATGGFPQAQVYIIAEKASALIQAEAC